MLTFRDATMLVARAVVVIDGPDTEQGGHDALRRRVDLERLVSDADALRRHQPAVDADGRTRCRHDDHLYPCADAQDRAENLLATARLYAVDPSTERQERLAAYVAEVEAKLGRPISDEAMAAAEAAWHDEP